MATKKKPTEPSASAERNVMQIESDPKQREQSFANVTVEGLASNAVMLRSFSATVLGDIGITEAMKALRSTVKAVNGGDLSVAETILVGQASALNVMFAELARRAAANMGTHLPATEAYMRLALKAQAQCRATLETLAAIKNPPVVFAKQANINNGGQQQVNNGPAPDCRPIRAGAHAEETDSQRSELLEASNGQGLDTRATGAAGGADQDLAPVGAITRAAHGAR